MDQKKLEQAARLIIEAVGEDPEREGLVETPRRFAAGAPILEGRQEPLFSFTFFPERLRR